MIFRRKPEIRRALDPTTGRPIPKPNLTQRILMKFLSNKLRDILKNWKTTLAGVAMIGEGIHVLAGHAANFAGGADLALPTAQVGWGMILGGIGFLFAKDADKTGVAK